MTTETIKPHCPDGCDHEKPVTPGGDYLDNFVPAHEDYAAPEHMDTPETFKEAFFETMEFDKSKTMQGTCMECGYGWPIYVHTDRDDQELDDYRLHCPHCGSEAVVAQEDS